MRQPCVVMTRGCHFCVQMQKGTRQREVMKECLCRYSYKRKRKSRKNISTSTSYLIPGNRPLFPFRLRLCLLPSSYGRLHRPTLQCGRVGLAIIISYITYIIVHYWQRKSKVHWELTFSRLPYLGESTCLRHIDICAYIYFC